MATQASSYSEISGSGRRLGVIRVGAAAGVSAALVFILCWLGTFVPFGSPTHAYVTLFTPSEMQSVQALGEGTLWSLLFGAFVGAVFAIVYNAFGGLNRR